MTSNPSPQNPRLSALNATLGDSKPYRCFVACAEARGHQWRTDADLEAFEKANAPMIKFWDRPFEHWGQLWITAAQYVLDGRISWLNQFPKVEGAEATYFEE